MFEQNILLKNRRDRYRNWRSSSLSWSRGNLKPVFSSSSQKIDSKKQGCATYKSTLKISYFFRFLSSGGVHVQCLDITCPCRLTSFPPTRVRILWWGGGNLLSTPNLADLGSPKIVKSEPFLHHF